MLKTYGIIGSGTAADNVIEDALTEIGEDNKFIVVCPSKPSKGLSRAIEWLIDREVSYLITCTEDAPTNFVDNAFGCEYFKKEENAIQKFLDMVRQANGSLLLLWDDTKNEEMEKLCFDAADAGITIRDLSNGLVPIRVEGEPQPTVEEKHTPTAEIEVEPLSKEELQSLPIAMLHKIAKSKGLNPDLNYETTEALISRILYADSIKAGEQDEDYLPPIDLGTFRIVSTRESVITTKEETCMLTVVFPSGIVMSRPATPYEAKQLFGFEPAAL